MNVIKINDQIKLIWVIQ